MMKHLVLNFCAASLCCFLAIVGNAQNKNDSTIQNADSKVSTADAKVTSSYDEAKNQTIVEFRMLGIANTQTERVVLSVSATYQGRKPEKLPDDVIFILSIASTKDNRFPKTMMMEITADGKELPQVLMLNANKRRLSEEDKRNYLETLVTRMKYEIFKQLMQAKSVILKLPDLTLQLDETRMAKMKELDNLLHP
jgi:hypothetical protein